MRTKYRGGDDDSPTTCEQALGHKSWRHSLQNHCGNHLYIQAQIQDFSPIAFSAAITQWVFVEIASYSVPGTAPGASCLCCSLSYWPQESSDPLLLMRKGGQRERGWPTESASWWGPPGCAVWGCCLAQGNVTELLQLRCEDFSALPVISLHQEWT